MNIKSVAKTKIIINEACKTVKTKELETLLDLCIEIDIAVDKICKQADHFKYRLFNGNHCIQTAGAVKYIVDSIFGSEPGYEMQIMYGLMTDGDSRREIYNHAYLSMRYKNAYYVIDVSRKTRDALIACSSKAVYYYGTKCPMSITGYEDIIIHQLDKINFKDIIDEPQEFFTLEHSKKFLDRVKELCQSRIDNFNI